MIRFQITQLQITTYVNCPNLANPSKSCKQKRSSVFITVSHDENGNNNNYNGISKNFLKSTPYITSDFNKKLALH